MRKKKLLLVGGARPNFMKLSPLIRELKKYKSHFVYKIVHTGQHYDYVMSKIFFEELGIPKPRYFLGIGSGSHATQVAKIMVKFEEICFKENPHYVIVVGDVNSTLAAALAAKKSGINVAHIEAGLRSFDMRMPEEINRVITDDLSDTFFVTEKSGLTNLIKEGKDKSKIFLVGDIMIDNLCFALKKLKHIDKKDLVSEGIKKKFFRYAVLTFHRPSNVDNKKVLSFWMRNLDNLSREIPTIFPVHPRTMKNIKKFKIRIRNIFIMHPLGFFDFVNLLKDATCVLTDSGGIQVETSFLGIPCVSLREETERLVTVERGTNIVMGRNTQLLREYIRNILNKRKIKTKKYIPLHDGRTAQRIAAIMRRLCFRGPQ